MRRPAPGGRQTAGAFTVAAGRRFAPSCATAAARPTHLPTNCPASSLRSLQDSSPHSWFMRPEYSGGSFRQKDTRNAAPGAGRPANGRRLRRGSGRRFAPSCATIAARPTYLPTNCPASSLRSLQDSSPGGRAKLNVEEREIDARLRMPVRSGVLVSGQECPLHTNERPHFSQRTREMGHPLRC